jgi:solute carrier family 38 (sodium-coupled neutral amino acid transporter), member 11
MAEEDLEPSSKPSRNVPLSIQTDTNIEDDPDVHPSRPYRPQRISSFAQPRPDGAPRTPNRVRFEIDEMTPPSQRANGHASGAEWVDEEDYLGADDSETPMLGQRAPLLTDLEAPSVTVAMEFEPEDHLESARPRSNMRNAFMNMANSIMLVS